jgi:hypothetical protein
MLTLSTEQADLKNRSALVAVPLVVLTTYSDRDAETADSVYYWSTVPVHYPWNAGADCYFRDLIVSMGPIENTMPHLTLQGGNVLGQTELRMSVGNDQVDGVYLWQTLRAEAYIRARIEVAEILLNPDRMMVSGGSAWWDLRDLAGNEHTYRFRGELARIDSVTDGGTIDILFRTERVEVPLIYLLDEARNDPRDFGLPLPIIYGAADHIPLLNVEVGWVTTLAQALTDATIGIVAVTDATGFPVYDSFDLIISGESITCSESDHTNHTITIASRGQNNTKAVPHREGETITETVETVRLGVASHPVTAIRDLYVVNPYSQTLIRFTQPWEEWLVDSELKVGSFGASIRIQKSDMIAFLRSCQVAAQVLVQPEYESAAGSPTVVDEPPATRTTFAVDSGPDGSWNNIATTPYFRDEPSGLDYRLRATFTGALDNVHNIARWRLHVSATISNFNEGYGWCRLYAYNIPGIPDGLSIYGQLSANGTIEVYSNWYAPPDATKLLALVTAGAYFEIAASAGEFDPGDYPLITLDIFEIEAERESTYIIDQTIDTEIDAAATGFGLRFFADVDGMYVPYVFSEGYGFDDDTGWNVLAGTQSEVTGAELPDTPAQKLTATETLRYDCEATTGWTPSNATHLVEATPHTQGTYSLEVTSTGTSVASDALATIGPFNWAGLVLLLDVRPQNVAGSDMLADGDGIRIRLSSANDGNTLYKEFYYGTHHGITNQYWSTIALDLSNLPTADASAGTFNPGAIRHIRVSFNVPGGVEASGHKINIDWIRTTAKLIRMQRVGTTEEPLVLTSQDARYRIWLNAYASPLLSRVAGEEIRFWISNTVGSGTTQPANRVECAVPSAALAEAEWVECEALGVDEGTPVITDVETIGIEYQLGSGVTTPNVGPPSLTVDLLQKAAATNANYTDAPGTLLTNMSAVVRHFIADYCGLGHAAIGATLTKTGSAESNLSANVYGGPVTVYGYDFSSILAGLAFEGRGNIVAEEAAAGTVYHFHTADIVIGFATWPASVRTIDTWKNLRESTRDAAEIATRFRAFWAWDPFLGSDGSAFTKLARVDKAVSSVVPLSVIQGCVDATGDREANPLLLYLVRDSDTAEDVLAGYVAEIVRHQAGIWEMDLPHWIAYDLERGDVVGFTPPWATGRNARILSIAGSFVSPARRVTLIEVL